MKDTYKNDFFKIELIKPNKETEMIYYRKDKENFQGEYAIVKAFSKDHRFSKYTWYGIVNKNFETVVDFKIRNNMKWFPENHLVFSEKRFEQGREQEFAFVYRWNQTTFEQVELFSKIQKRISSDIIQVESLLGEVYLFDVTHEKVLSNGFHQIGNFQECNGNLVAVASRRLQENEINSFYQRSVEVFCYIDLNGNIVSPVYNPFNNQYETVTKEEFELYIYGLQHSLPDHYDKIEILQDLKNKIKKQK